MKHIIWIPLALLIALPTSAASWVPAECGPEFAKAWQRHATMITDAPRGSHLYIPKPFPRNDRDVIEDFRYGYLDIWKDGEFDEQPELAKVVYDGLSQGTLRFEISRVENWSPTRCGPSRKRTYYHLLRIFGANGSEIARAALNEDGLLAAWQFAPEDSAALQAWRSAIPQVDREEQAAASVLGVKLAESQYVHTSGPLYCPLLQPCVASKAQGKIYIRQKGKLFAVVPQSQRFSGKQVSDPKVRKDLLGNLRATKATLVSVGHNQFAVAAEVAPKEP